MRHAALLVCCVLGLIAVGATAVAQEAVRAQEAADLAHSRQEAMHQLMEIGIALQNHHDVYKRYPGPAILDADKKPLLSWRVKILPFLEQHDLYKRFHLNEPWDSEHNKELIKEMPTVYACLGSKVADKFRTVYVAPRIAGSLFGNTEGTQIRKITDGLSNTIAVVEVDDELAVTWTKPDDWTINEAMPTANLGGHFPEVFLTLAADGAVHAVPTSINERILKALLSISGQEVIQFPGR